MNMSLLLSVMEGKITFSDALLYMAVGIVGVFIVLLILILILSLFKYFFEFDVPAKIAARFKRNKKVALFAEELPLEEEEEIAAVMAAVSCMLSSQQKLGAVAPFFIKNIKRIK